MNITAGTRLTGIFGYPVSHSLSPLMHNAAFDALGLDYRYMAFPVPPEMLKDAVEAIRALNIAGVNVTIPHKESVMQYLDEIDAEARFIGAVNTIHNNDGRLYGYNTDGRGFIRSLEEEGIGLAGKRVFVIGAGGAARAVSYYIGKADARLFILNRSRERLDALIENLERESIFASAALDNMMAREADIIVNTTPLGLKDGDPLPIETGYLHKGQIVCDLIYKDTRLLKEARKLHLKTFNGSGMLLWQGALAFKIWTGYDAPVDIMRRALR